MTLAVARKQSQDSASKAKRDDARHAPRSSPQRQSSFTRPFIQRKPTCACGGGCPRCEEQSAQEGLEIGHPKDGYEREAHWVAEQVTRAPDPRLREMPLIWRRRAAHPAEPAMVPPIAQEVLRSPGQPLDSATRAFIEPRFGHDFGHVRVHNDGKAIESAREVNALAYTVGRHIVFGEGQSVLHTANGQRSLAHELAHVVQQERGGPSASTPQRGSMLEQAADAATSAFAAGRGTIHVGGASTLVLARQALFGTRSPGANPKPRSLGESLIATALTDAELVQEIDLLLEWLDDNPVQSLEGTHLSSELERLQAEESRRIERIRRQQKYREDLARVIDAVNAGKIPRWMKVFPFRPSRGPFRVDVAPIMARRQGDKIVVEQPLLGVAYTDMFKKDVKTLPGDVFTGGHTLRPNELVGVRLYDEGEKVVVVYATDLLKFSEASDRAVFINIALTAASVVGGPAVGRLGGRALSAVVGSGQRLAQRGLVAATLGTAEAAPTALGGIASRTSVALVEGRAASTFAQQTIAQTTVRAGVQTATVQSTVRAGAQTLALTVSPSLTGLAGTAGGIISTQVAGATLVQVSPAEYAARLSFVTPQQFDNPVLNAVERAGQQAAAVLTNPATPAGARFIQTCQNRNWALAGTLFHAEAARQLRAIAPSLSGIQITAEDTVQAGRGGSRLDVTAIDASRNHYDIDWKTTGRSALTVKSRAEMRRHSAQYQANRGAPLDLQISKSWVDFVRSLIPNVTWPK